MFGTASRFMAAKHHSANAIRRDVSPSEFIAAMVASGASMKAATMHEQISRVAGAHAMVGDELLRSVEPEETKGK